MALPMPAQTTSSSALKNRFTLTTLLFLFFFLSTIIFLFSKRALEPSLSLSLSLSLYRDLISQTPSASSSSSSSSSEPTTFPISEPVSPNPQPEPKQAEPSVEIVNEELADKNDENQFQNEEGYSGINIEGLEKCDFYSGAWVKDEGYPLYAAESCPYVDEAFDCQANGRADSDYLYSRWKPHACDLPKFNATDFLAKLRGKKMMLVGDSTNRNQFKSILCLLHEGLHNKSTMYKVHGHKITKGRGYYVFKFEHASPIPIPDFQKLEQDYNCTVDFVRSYFLVREGVRINGDGNSNPTLSIDRIDKSVPRWKRADILVFNAGHWWTHGKTARGKNYYEEGDYVYPKFDAVEAYRRSLKTWSNWIDKNVNPEKQLVFYRGYSSAHFRGGDWDSGGSCNGETEPAFSDAILDNYPLKTKIVEETIKVMKFPVKLLNVTGLTNFRKDGHPSIFGKNSTATKKVTKRRQECSHWCLPGVPDTWNELIYATLLLHQTNSVSNTR